jgi:acyl CoA:acetate/3-ketoacid CoA transferase
MRPKHQRGGYEPHKIEIPGTLVDRSSLTKQEKQRNLPQSNARLTFGGQRRRRSTKTTPRASVITSQRVSA